MVISASTDRYSVSIFDLPFIVDAEDGLLSNDISTTGDNLTALLDTPPDEGSVELERDGSFLFTPGPGFLGIDRFTYTAIDSAGRSDTATVQIQVNILADPSSDAIRGTSNSDVLRGGVGDDYLLGFGGDDTLIGRAGNDLINGGSGSDFILGRAGQEVIDGGNGNDTLDGGANLDILVGGSGRDVLLGRRGDDFLFGGRGQDSLQGSAGNDTLRGGDGLDTLRGGAGADFFVIETETGVDTIRDFTLGQDTFSLNGLVFGDLSFAVADDVTRISAGGELIARVRIRGGGTLEDRSNFNQF